jgi:integrase
MPKTNAGVRIIPMLSDVKAALQKEYEKQSILGFNETVIDGYTGFIFQNRYGDALSAHNINRAIDRIVQACNDEETILAAKENREPFLIRHFSVHNLRHTFATRFCEHETNLKVIQEIMGHADIETTMNIYAEATKEMKKRSMDNLEGKIRLS